MPKAFQEAGYVLGIVTTTVLAFVSYLAFTFVVESMSAANAVLATKKAQKLKELAVEAAYGSDNIEISGSYEESQDRQPVSPYYSALLVGICVVNWCDEIIFLMCQMESKKCYAKIHKKYWSSFFDKKTNVFQKFKVTFRVEQPIYFYFCVTNGQMPFMHSLFNTYAGNTSWHRNISCINYNISIDSQCWNTYTTSRITVYRILVCLFALVIGPFVFLNVSKTKYLQFCTTLSRWTAFVLMIAFACRRLASGDIEGHPPLANAPKFSNLFGICVYAFMCHHSLPSVVTPMKTKNGIYPLVFVVYCIILSFYITLSLTGAFAFANLEDIYTLNFLRQCSEGGASILFVVVQYFLALFPVFTLSTNFPIVGITLRNNIIALTSNVAADASKNEKVNFETEHTDGENVGDIENVDRPEIDIDPHSPLLEIKNEINLLNDPEKLRTRLFRKFLVPILVLLPPIIISLCTDNVEFLASVTGSYAGVGVQYVIPALLVWGARKRNFSGEMPDTYVSPFAHKTWVYCLFGWSILTVVVVTVNHIMSGF